MVKKYLRQLLKWVMSSDQDVPQPEEVTSYNGRNSIKSTSIGSPGTFGQGINGMNFIVYGAIGGKVVQFTTYDQIRDKGYTNLYIITDKEDLGEEIGQIITKESLSR